MQGNNVSKTKSDYGMKIAMFIDNPKHMGEIDPEEAKSQGLRYFSFQYGAASYGYELTFHWAIDPFANAIKEAKYTFNGPVLGIAALQMLSVMLTNKNLSQLKNTTFNALEKFLRDNPHVPAIDQDEAYLLTYAIDALKQAADKYSNVPIEYDNVTPLCPEHSPLSIASIRTIIAEQNITQTDVLRNFTRIDMEDASCQEKAVALIEEVQNEMKERKAMQEALQSTPFEELSEEQRVAAAETAIDQTVRDYLIMDGGDIEVLSVKENDGGYDVYVSYLGACSSCESSGGTLVAIENALRDKLTPNVRVLSV